MKKADLLDYLEKEVLSLRDDTLTSMAEDLANKKQAHWIEKELIPKVKSLEVV